jgi:hypothetical protein
MVELHFHDADFTFFAPTWGSDDDTGETVDTAAVPEDEDEDDAAAAGDASGPNPLGALVALGVLVLIAFAVRRLVGGDEDQAAVEDHAAVEEPVSVADA